MDIRLIYLPSGGLAETHGSFVRLTTPSAGALAAHRLTRREIQEATVAEACKSETTFSKNGSLLVNSRLWRYGAETRIPIIQATPRRISAAKVFLINCIRKALRSRLTRNEDVGRSSYRGRFR